MKIPQQIEHLGHIYQVVSQAPVCEEAEGSVDFHNLTISLDPELRGSRLDERFFHEICHVAFDSSGLKYMLKQKIDNEMTEEMFVDVFSQSLFGLLKNNNII
jgi:hypothetical protein